MGAGTHELSRRQVLELGGLTALSGLLFVSCWRNEPTGGGSSSSPSATAPTREEIKQKLLEGGGDHHGGFTRSLMDCEINNRDYLDLIRAQADQFTCGGRALPVTLEADSERDCGGLWANDMLLSGVLTQQSAQQVARFVRDETGDSSIPDGMVAFGYHRFVDAGASREYGSPLLGNRRELTFFPGMVIWLPEDEPKGAESLPPDVERQLSDMEVPSTIYVLSGGGVRAVATAGQTQHTSLEGTRADSPKAMLDRVVGLGPDAAEQFALIGATQPLASGIDPARFGWEPGDVVYTRMEGGVDFTAKAPPASTATGESREVTAAPPVPPQQTDAFANGSVSQTGQGLVGNPTVPTPDPAPAITWGPPSQMPRNHIPWGILYGTVGNSPSSDACSSSVDTVHAIAMSITGTYLVTCGKIVLANIAWCGPFFWLCGIGGMAVCAATAAGLAVLANMAANQARSACRQPNLTYS